MVYIKTILVVNFNKMLFGLAWCPHRTGSVDIFVGPLRFTLIWVID